MAFLNDADHGKKALMPYANSKRRSACASVQSALSIFSLTAVGNEGPDQPAQMCRLIWACNIHRLHKGPFRVLCTSNVFFYLSLKAGLDRLTFHL